MLFQKQEIKFILEKETIEQLVKKGYNLQAQVLKVPHHGMQDILKNTKKARSDHRYLFQRVKAKIAVISNGYKNSYKAPHKKTLNELKTANVYDTGGERPKLKDKKEIRYLQ